MFEIWKRATRTEKSENTQKEHKSKPKETQKERITNKTKTAKKSASRKAKEKPKDKSQNKQKRTERKKPSGKGSARNPCGGTLWGALSVCCVCAFYVYIIIIYRAWGFVWGLCCGCVCVVLGFVAWLIVLIVITYQTRPETWQGLRRLFFNPCGLVLVLYCLFIIAYWF